MLMRLFLPVCSQFSKTCPPTTGRSGSDFPITSEAVNEYRKYLVHPLKQVGRNLLTNYLSPFKG